MYVCVENTTAPSWVDKSSDNHGVVYGLKPLEERITGTAHEPKVWVRSVSAILKDIQTLLTSSSKIARVFLVADLGRTSEFDRHN